MTGIDNRPRLPESGPWQEVWYLKLNQPEARRALWLRFTLLRTLEGKRVAEVWAIAFEDGAAPRKIGLKNTHALETFAHRAGGGVAIAESDFADARTSGSVISDAHAIRWDLEMRPAAEAGFDFVPSALRRLGLVKNLAVTPFEDLRFSGWSEVDGVRCAWENAPGMQGHLAGPKNGHSWAWGHCNHFVDESGAPSDLVFDGLSARARLGSARSTPLLSTFYVRYGGREYALNGVRHLLRTRSRYSPVTWQFEARAGSMAFRGEVRAALEDFAGVTYEDTDGSLLYCHNSKISDMTLEVFREGAREARFTADGTVAFEFVSREKHPGVEFVI